MKLIVNKIQRHAKMRAHTATHLLHAELGKIFPHTKQAGSYVDQDITRFDFHAKEQLTQDQIIQIEYNINKLIKKGINVEAKEYSYDEAIQMGAKAFFGDKYGKVVRVVTIGSEKNSQQHISIELCGGTHVRNTSDIGVFKIISQESVAAGIKRITALTGPRTIEYIQEKEKTLENIAKLLNVQVAQIEQKLEKEIAEKKELEQQVESLQAKLLSSELKDLAKKSNKDQIDYTITIPDSLINIGFKNIVNQAKNIFSDKNIIIKTQSSQFAILGQNGLNAKKFANQYGLKGGGSDFLFQGKDPQINDL